MISSKRHFNENFPSKISLKTKAKRGRFKFSHKNNCSYPAFILRNTHSTDIKLVSCDLSVDLYFALIVSCLNTYQQQKDIKL